MELSDLGDGVYKVETLKQRRVRGGRVEYLVKWKGKRTNFLLIRRFLRPEYNVLGHLLRNKLFKTEYRICRNKRPLRNKRPPKTVIFQRGEYMKPMGFDGWFFQRGEYMKPMGFYRWFFKGGSTQNRMAFNEWFFKGWSTWNRWVLMGFGMFFYCF